MTLGGLVPALPSWLITPLWDQFRALLPQRSTYHLNHPLGCHRPRIPDRVIFDKLVQVLVFGCGYRKIADATCSSTTIRDCRDEWIQLGLFARLELLILAAYDRMVGLDLGDLAVDGCITKAPCGGQHAGRSPVDRGKRGRKRSTMTEARGIPLGAVQARANIHDSPLLGPTLDTLERLGPMPEQPTVHLDRGYDSGKTRKLLIERGMTGQIAERGQPAPVQASRRWPVERTNAWGNQFKKLAWNTERCDPVMDAFVAFAHAIITLRRLIRCAWTLYRWDTRPQRRP
jgi:transposase